MNNEAELLEIQAIITGHVQGVGFRALTRRIAQHIGLKGIVQNLKDGRVKIVAQGSKIQIEELIRDLKEKTTPGQIKNVDLEYVALSTLYRDFSII